MEVPVFCLIAAFVVFILERFFLTNHLYLRKVAIGCIAAAALFKVFHTIETLVCLIAAVVVVILKLFVLTDNEYLKWIAVGCIVVAALLKAVVAIPLRAVCLLGAIIGIITILIQCECITIPSWIVDAWKSVVDGWKWVKNAWTWVVNAWEMVPIAWNWITNAIRQIPSLMGDAWEWLTNKVAEIPALLGDAWERLKNAVQTIPSLLGDAWNWLKNALTRGVEACRAFPSWLVNEYEFVANAWRRVMAAWIWVNNALQRVKNAWIWVKDACRAAAELFQAIRADGLLVFLCLIAVAVVILIWFILKKIPVLKWLTSGCIAIIVAFMIIRLSRHGGQG